MNLTIFPIILMFIASVAQAQFATVTFPVAEGGSSWTHTNGSPGHYGLVCNNYIDELAIDLNLNTPLYDTDNGKAVRAVADGSVVNFANCLSSYGTTYGAVMVRHQIPLLLTDGTVLNEWFSGYLHMSISNVVSPPMAVIGGQTVLGRVSNVAADNYHLHFAIYAGTYPSGLVAINLRNVAAINNRIVSASWICYPTCYPPAPTSLANGVSVNSSTNSSAKNNDLRDFKVSLPAGVSSMRVELFNLTGDIDLHTRSFYPASRSFWSCRPFVVGTGSEVCDIANPAAGEYYFRAYGFQIGAVNFSAKATWTASGSTFPLSISRNGTGSGTVTSSPAGINCGLTCSFNFTANQSVTLIATPASGSTFAGWSGACSGTSCTVTMSAARSVTATFNTSGGYVVQAAVSANGTFNTQ